MDEIIKIRRQIHQNPELSFCEYKTAETVAKYLEKLGLSPRCRIAKTGVTADIKGGEGKTILLRADMDALPVTEQTGLSYASENSGVMHACGHDAHIAVLLMCARILCENKDRLCGTVRLVFQPGEETAGGALPMINEGILENPKVDAAFAYHVTNEAPTGSVIIKKGSLMASPDNFYITVKGIGGHGGQPKNCKNPINIAAQIVNMLNKIICENYYVLSVCSIKSGSSENVVPDAAYISGTARTLTPAARDYIQNAIENVCADAAKQYETSVECDFVRLYPPLINDEKMIDMFSKTARRVLGAEHVLTQKNADMIGEDFSYFAQEVPACMVKLGGATAPLHSPNLTVDDEAVFTGAKLMSEFVFDYLKQDMA